MANAEDREGSAVMPSPPAAAVPVGREAAAVVAAAAVVSWAMTLPTMASKRIESLMLNHRNECDYRTKRM
jgi:hypothetical protein